MREDTMYETFPKIAFADVSSASSLVSVPGTLLLYGTGASSLGLECEPVTPFGL
jgi:hypothetical protein